MLFFARKADKKTAEKSGFPILQDPKNPLKKVGSFQNKIQDWTQTQHFGGIFPPPFFLEKSLTVNQQRLFEPAI